MPVRRLALSLSLFALLLAPAAATAAPKGEGGGGAKLPPACAAAGAQTMAECQALLKRGGAKGKAPAGAASESAKPAPAAANPAAPKPPAAKPQPEKPAPPRPEAAKPAPPKPAAAKPEAPTPEAAKPAAPKPEAAKPAPPKPAAAKPEAPKPEAAKPEAAPAAEAPDCRKPGARRDPACRAARPERGRGKPAAMPAPAAPAGAAKAPAGTPAPAPEKPAAPKPEAAKPAAPKPAAPKPAPEPKTAAPAGPAAPATPKPAAPAAPAAPATPAAPAAPAAAPSAAAPAAPAAANEASAPIAPDCLAVGISTAAQCDAFQARRQHRQGAGARGAQPGGARQPREPVAKLPPGVKPEQLAPLLDSAKQREAGGVETPAGTAAPRTRQAAPPSNDAAAQASVRLKKAPPLPPPGAQPAEGKPPSGGIELPQNVTVVNQTVINNTEVNNTTVNNNTPGETERNGRRGGRGGFGRPGLPPPGALPPPPPGAPAGQATRREPNPIGLAIGAVLQLGDRLIVDSSGRDQYRISGRDRYRTQYAELPQNRYMETIYRPNDVRIVTIYDRDGDVLRRSRFDADGHETVLAYFDYGRDKDLGQWRDPGADLPPLQLDIDVNNYVLDAAQADERRLQGFLAQPPVEPVPRLYSIDEVERSARLRDIMPRIELADLTFDTGSATLAPDQVQNLSDVADAMLALLERNPAETFLIEGHTDAVGSPASNLVLSDARAAEVAEILTDIYHVPPENLATQGYGAEFLRVQTAAAERLNRRVVIRRITPLVTIAQGND